MKTLVYVKESCIQLVLLFSLKVWVFGMTSTKQINVELPTMLRFMLKNYLTQNLKNNIYWIQHVTYESSTVLKKTQCP